MSAAQWIADLDRYANAVTDEDCDRYMEAYEKIYGVDSAPFWTSRYEWKYFDSVEIAQYENGH